jgi:Rrf2 family transcriptional regulator, iron-sulfur cluster assembly transcription factor
MKLGTKGRYAVMALVDLARSSQGNPVTLRDIGMREEISLHYLEQIFLKLRRANIVSSLRGVYGGYVLTREPQDISVYDIMQAVEEPLHSTQCKPGSDHGCKVDRARCSTHDFWNHLGEYISAYLKTISLADVTSGYSCGKVFVFPHELNMQPGKCHASVS